MTLLNGLLALGAFAFSIPLVIHLFYRSRFRTVDWGAMHLLESVVRINRRRIQVLNLLLLLVRCLIPILLAFCLARPLLTGFTALPGDAPQSLVLAVDDSRSMSISDSDGVSRIERAKVAIDEVLGNLSRRDEVMIVRSSSPDAAVGQMGPSDARRKIRAMQANSGPVDLGRLVRSAFQRSGEATHPYRRILLVSDFQSTMLDDAALQTLDEVGRLSTADVASPSVGFLNIAAIENGGPSANVSIESVRLETAAAVVGRTSTFVASVRNHGEYPVTDLRLAWSVGGVDQPSTKITIPARSSVSTKINPLMADVGVAEVSVAIEHADSLPLDNQRAMAVDVIREIQVVLVDGNPSSQPFEGETDFLAIALSPFSLGGPKQGDAKQGDAKQGHAGQGDAVKTKVIGERDLDTVIRRSEVDVIVLAGVPDPTVQTRSWVGNFVANGGAAIIFDNHDINADSYNQSWGQSNNAFVLPGRLESFVGSTDTKSDPVELSSLNANYSPWNLLADSRQDLSSQIEVTGYRKLVIAPDVPDPRDPDPRDPDPRRPSHDRSDQVTLLSTASGDPLIVMADRGKGKLIQFAIAADADGSTLPLRTVFLPMMQQLVLDLAGTRRDVNLDFGEMISIAVDELTPPDKIGEPSKSSLQEFYVTLPGGNEQELLPTKKLDKKERGTLFGHEALMNGTYRFRSETSVGGIAQGMRTLRVVEVSASESDWRAAEETRLLNAAGKLNATVFTDVGSIIGDNQTDRFGREIWRGLLVLVLSLLVIEIWLQQRLVRPKAGNTPSSLATSNGFGTSHPSSLPSATSQVAT